jgi:hypothetical protein
MIRRSLRWLKLHAFTIVATIALGAFIVGAVVTFRSTQDLSDRLADETRAKNELLTKLDDFIRDADAARLGTLTEIQNDLDDVVKDVAVLLKEPGRVVIRERIVIQRLTVAPSPRPASSPQPSPQPSPSPCHGRGCRGGS